MTTPFYNELFWKIYQPFNGNSDFALDKIFHYNSLTNEDFVNDINNITLPQFTYLPQRIIKNHETLSLEKTEALIKNRTTFIKVNPELNEWYIDEPFVTK